MCLDTLKLGKTRLSTLRPVGPNARLIHQLLIRFELQCIQKLVLELNHLSSRAKMASARAPGSRCTSTLLPGVGGRTNSILSSLSLGLHHWA